MFVNPNTPAIVEIARKYTETYPDRKPLKEALDTAFETGVGFQELESTPILTEGARDVFDLNPDAPYFEYLRAVAMAQVHLQREGNELLELKLQIIANYTKERRSKVLAAFTELGEGLGDYETDFYNYLIDILMQIYESKKAEEQFSGSSDGEEIIDVGIIDSHLTSGEYGFRLDFEKAEEIADLIMIGARSQIK